MQKRVRSRKHRCYGTSKFNFVVVNDQVKLGSLTPRVHDSDDICTCTHTLYHTIVHYSCVVLFLPLPVPILAPFRQSYSHHDRHVQSAFARNAIIRPPRAEYKVDHMGSLAALAFPDVASGLG